MHGAGRLFVLGGGAADEESPDRRDRAFAAGPGSEEHSG